MAVKAKLKSRYHSGRLRPHEYTSYLPLAIMVFFVGIVLAAMTVSSFAFATTPPPQAESVSLSGTMPEKPPTTGATITSPSNLTSFNSSPITVSGTCPKNTLVEIFKNGIFAGSTPCDNNNNFSVQIDLLYGQNKLTAVDYDVLNQAGPSSSGVNVTYTAQPPLISSLSNVNFTNTQLVLETDAVYRGVFPGQTLNVPINIIGGNGPFAINVQWGDNQDQVLPSSNNTTINASHVYAKPGVYKIIIQGSDAQQHIAFLTVAAIINGQPSAATASSSSSSGSNSLTGKILVLWPLYAIAATLVISFWMGEVREKKLMDRVISTTPTLGVRPHPIR